MLLLISSDTLRQQFNTKFINIRKFIKIKIETHISAISMQWNKEKTKKKKSDWSRTSVGIYNNIHYSCDRLRNVSMSNAPLININQIKNKQKITYFPSLTLNTLNPSPNNI